MITAVHTTCGFLSLLLGAYMFLTRKGTRRHILIGRLYCATLVTLNLTAFGIYRIFGTFGIFHVFAVVSLLTVLAGIIPVLLRRCFKNWMSLHYQFMSWSYAGLLAATSNEAFVHLPPLQQLVRLTSPWLPLAVMFGVLIASARVINQRMHPTLAKYGMPCSALDETSDSVTNRRLWQFSLRALLLSVLFVASLAGCVRLVYQSHQRTQRLLAMIDSVDGLAQTELVGPAWVNRLLERSGIDWLQRIVSVEFGGARESMQIRVVEAPAPPTAVATVAQVIAALRDESNLRELTMRHHSGLTDKDLVGIEDLTSLEELTINGPGITDQTGRRIGPLRSLRRLELSFTEVSDETLHVVSSLGELEHLELAGTDITDAGVTRLGDLKKLVHFEPRSTRITDASMKTIALWPDLQSLDLSSTAVTAAGLAELRNAEKLKSLSLGHTDTNDEGLAELAHISSLTGLGLGNTKITDAGLVHLRQMKNLRTLHIEYTSIKDEGMAHLAGLTDLTKLIVGHTKITSAGLAHVRGMTELDQLYFGGTAVDDRFVDHIAYLPKLRLLSISGCSVTPAIFTKMMHMTSIEQFYIHNPSLVTSLQAKAFVAANGHPNVLR